MASWTDDEDEGAIVAAYEASGQTRREFSEARGMSVARLDALRRNVPSGESGQMVRVELAGGEWVRPPGLVLVLANGRRIGVGAGFDAAALERLLPLAEGR